MKRRLEVLPIVPKICGRDLWTFALVELHQWLSRDVTPIAGSTKLH
jgi:hypothetical protein